MKFQLSEARPRLHLCPGAQTHSRPPLLSVAASWGGPIPVVSEDQGLRNQVWLNLQTTLVTSSFSVAGAYMATNMNNLKFKANLTSPSVPSWWHDAEEKKKNWIKV